MTRIRARFLIGTALGAAVGIWLSRGALLDARRALLDESQERQAVVSLSALGALLQAGGAGFAGDGRSATARSIGDEAQQALAKWQPENPSMARVRVARGMQLLASSAAEDKAPRRLQRDEKPLYDRAQRLATAVQTNRDEGARKPEIEVTWLDGRRLSLAAPLEGGGIVEIETAAQPMLPPPPIALVLLVALAPVLLFALIGWRIGERPVSLAILSTLCLGGALLVVGRVSLDTIEREARTARAAVASVEAAQSKLLASPAPLDLDEFRKPRPPLAAPTVGLRRALLADAALALALLLLSGLGAFSRLGHTLRKNRQAYLYIAPAIFGMLLLV
ncbi:MAG TPA: hypothetical protein VLW85_04965, partial [Myxococcales bacterium]|nr:hypothetical protein [Myxococcales bacterium]